jgi:asparagine synthetase B (glutamine-hydrolysing)
VEWQTKVISVGAVRQTLTNELKNINGSVAVATSGGIDSSVLIMSCLDLGYKPSVLSFKMDNRPDSYDFDSARKLAKKFDLDFVPVLLPSSPEIILQKVIYEIKHFNIKKKTAIECVYPMMFVFDTCEQLSIQNLICGHAADGHYALSKKAMIHYRSTQQLYQQFRKAYFKNKNVAQSETLNQIAKEKNINLYLPYMQQTYFDLFNDLSWFEVNTPRQKELIRRDFPELDVMKLKNHLNLQLGDSYIAETIGSEVLKQIAPNAKSPITAYNMLWKKYGQA